jgi:hypothetical protein
VVKVGKFRWAWFDEEGNEVDSCDVVPNNMPMMDLSPQERIEDEGGIRIVTLKKVKVDATV